MNIAANSTNDRLSTLALQGERRRVQAPVEFGARAYELGDAPVRRTGLAAIAAPTTEADDRRAEAQEVATQFESLFMQEIVKGMREGADVLGEGGVFGGGIGSDTFSQWFDQHMSAHLTDPEANGGNGLGVVDAILENLVRNRLIPAEAAAGAPAPHLDRPTPEFASLDAR
jgi:hypothetical protein